MSIWKTIKNVFDVMIRKFDSKSLQIKEEEKKEKDSLEYVQEQLHETSVIKRLKKRNVKSRKDI